MVDKQFYKTREDGVNLISWFSTEGKRLYQNETGKVYDSPLIDVENAPYTYTEVEDEELPTEDRELTAEEALELILGGEVE